MELTGRRPWKSTGGNPAVLGPTGRLASELPRGLSEAQFQAGVIEAATWYRWHVHHGRPARTEKGWRTAIQGTAGFPDLVLARRGVVILAELKTDRAQPTLNQRGWLRELGAIGRLWRPADWPEIIRELSSH